MAVLKKQKVTLDKDEAWLEENFESLSPLSKKEKDEQLHILKQAAVNYTAKNQSVNVLVYENDLDQIKRLALKEGLPYQTFITSVLHKLATGQLLAT